MKIRLLLSMLFFAFSASAIQSTCYGTTSNGRLENGVQLPSNGPNYIAYSTAAKMAGRTYVHSSVKDMIVASYKDLEIEQPHKVYKYAETGFKNGGRFRPHKTHMNGLSVDFMVPVTNVHGESVHLPTNFSNRLGYDIEFDEHSAYDGLKIDYEAMAAHIVALHKQAIAAGYDIWRVIFDPELQPNLFETQYDEYLAKNIQFSKKRSWVRHDQHYHVDFLIPCKDIS